VEEIQVSLHIDKKNGYFAWKPMPTYDNISQNSSHMEKCFRRKFRQNYNTRFVPITFFSKVVPFMR